MSQEATDGHLMAIGIEFLDGDHRAAGGPTGQPDDALVDATEAALADLEQAAEVAGGGPELPEPELAEAVGSPLLVQLRDAPRRRDRGRARRLARRGPHRRARVLGQAHANGRRRRGEGQVGARPRGDGGGERGGRRGRRRRCPLPPLLDLALLPLAAEAAEAIHRLEQKEAAGLSSRWLFASTSPSPPQSSNHDGNERHELLEIKPIKGTETFERRSFSRLTAQRAKNCVGETTRAWGRDVKRFVQNCLTPASPRRTGSWETQRNSLHPRFLSSCCPRRLGVRSNEGERDGGG